MVDARGAVDAWFIDAPMDSFMKSPWAKEQNRGSDVSVGPSCWGRTDPIIIFGGSLLFLFTPPTPALNFARVTVLRAE